MSKKILILSSVIIVLSIFFTGCKNPAKSIIEGIVKKKLTQMIGPAESYNVKVSGKTMKFIRGKLAGIDITGKNVYVKESGITIAYMHVNMQNVEVNTKKKTLENVDSTVYTASISQGEIQDYIIRTRNDIKDFSLMFEDGLIKATVRPSVGIIKPKVKFTSKVTIENGTKAVIDLKTLNILGLETPRLLKNFIEAKINPVFDANEIAYGTTIDDVLIEDGMLTVNGSLDLCEMIDK